MSFTHRKTLRLVARNEGKIKSYESCSDVRAWSHDVTARDRYLREWMKVDMPICVIPVSTLSGCLRKMTYKTLSRATPRCHPDCKSKVLLESICNSCEAVKKCLRQNENLEKYFLEEEFETSHWPCDRCLEALKSIKMFWKIIVEKLFHLSITKCESIVTDCKPANSLRTIAKLWQEEILQQTLYVEKLPSPLKKSSNIFKCGSPIRDYSVTSQKTCRADCNSNKQIRRSRSKVQIKSSDLSLTNKRSCRKVSKCTCFRTKMIDVGCDTCSNDGINKARQAYKRNIQVLRDKCNSQNEEITKLRKENECLKRELENVYTCCPLKKNYIHDYTGIEHLGVSVVPKPFETNLEENCPAKNIDSEMIITMKNCKNEDFKHVSLLQVVHKTNEPIDPNKQHGTYCKKEDPIEMLNKVQNTFGAIVRREISIVNARTQRPRKTEVDVSYHQMKPRHSAPSCSTPSSQLSSEADFISTKDFGDRNSVKTNI